VAIANGGTGQTTAAAAFNALSPITSTYDLIIGNGTNSATRLGIGTANQVLSVNSAGTAVLWAAAPTPSLSSPTVTGNLTFSTSNAGIIFNKSGALVNSTLNDYEEGTWTPTFTRSTTAPTLSYVDRLGKYTKIGRYVYITCGLQSTSLSGGSGAYLITGLPFTVSGTDYYFPGAAIADYSGIVISGTTPQFTLQVNSVSQSIVLLACFNDGSTSSIAPTVNSSFVLRFSAFYTT
jgi:hypothetical protein